MLKKIKIWLEFIQELFFPKVCEGCREVGTYLCEKCMLERIEFTGKQGCHVCKKQLPASSLQLPANLEHEECRAKTHLDGVFVVARYSKFIENFIGDIKYEFYYSMVDDLVNVVEYYFNSKYGKKYKTYLDQSFITFVPLNSWRRRWRGFNQAELLSVKLSKLWNLKCVKLLKRVRNTRKQVGLKRVQRLKNLKQAFEINRKELKKFSASSLQLSAVIVDDVMTTGATLEECAKVLKEAGFKRVYGLVVARG